jgi:poly-beta-1,6-N-acetyl-D-glucosamine synthase
MKVAKLVVYTTLYIITLGIIGSSIILKPHPIDSPFVSILRVIIILFASVLLAKYTVYMFLAPWHSIAASREQELIAHFVKNYRPLVSVMIPAWNEEVGLLGTIKTLLNSTYKNMEIVVVNDGSTDNSDALMRRFIAKYEQAMQGIPPEERIRIVYHYKENGGKGSALNRAVELSHGDILLSIDADCVVDRHAVESFVDAFRNPKVMAAVGNVKIGNTRTFIGQLQYLEFLFGFFFKKSDSLLNTIYIIGGAAGAFRREVFQRFRYSTTNITEDIELSMCIQDAGWKMVYCPKAIIYTEGAETLAGLQKQRNRWCHGRLQCFIEKRHMFFSLRPHHNKILTCVILPLAAFSGVQLTVEPIFITLLFVFSLMSGDFTGFISSILIVWVMFLIQSWDSNDWKRSMWLSGIGWLLFYAISYIELRALFKSLWLIIRKKEMKWQKWQRSGVIN